jgi:hypothetical protein
MDNKEDNSQRCKLPQADVNEVIPRLFLGNQKSSYDEKFIRENHITHIFRVMPEFDYNKVFRTVTYIHIPIRDNATCLQNLSNVYNWISDMIAGILLNGKNDGILIHCKRGHHRSAAVIAAFLIKYLKLDYSICSRYINSMRPCALRRDSCMVLALKECSPILLTTECKNRGLIFPKHTLVVADNIYKIIVHG